MADGRKVEEDAKMPVREIPYGHQFIDEFDVASVDHVLRSAWLTQGPNIRDFEDGLCKYTGARYAVAVSSGTAALHIACLAAGLKRGDEVITSPITFVASANCALYCQAAPVFADVDPGTANIDPDEVAKKISKKTKIVIPVHYAGRPCDLREITAAAGKSGSLIIEDAAHALGAVYKGAKIGSCRYSDMTIFSFHPVKSITTGEGGAVLTNDRKLYSSLMMFRNHGITKDPVLLDKKMRRCGWYYEMQHLGFNYRITDIQASLGTSQLRKLDSFIERRRRIADIYNKAFRGNELFDIPLEKEGSGSAYHLYPIRLKGSLRTKKKDVFSLLRSNGIGVQVHYMPVYLHPFYKRLGFRKGLCPNAEYFYEGEISIPIFPSLTMSDIKYVIKKIFEVTKKCAD